MILIVCPKEYTVKHTPDGQSGGPALASPPPGRVYPVLLPYRAAER